jgi:hypothetical protein
LAILLLLAAVEVVVQPLTDLVVVVGVLVGFLLVQHPLLLVLIP